MALSLHSKVAVKNEQWRKSEYSGNARKNRSPRSFGRKVNQETSETTEAVLQDLSNRARSHSSARRNTNDSISMLQTTDDALGTMSNILQRMRELALQASSESHNSTERSQTSTEFTALQSELTRLRGSVQFNGTRLLDGSLSVVAWFSGNKTEASDSDEGASPQSQAPGTLDMTTLSVSSSSKAKNATTSLEGLMEHVDAQRSRLDSLQNSMNAALTQLIGGQEPSATSASSIAGERARAQILPGTTPRTISQAMSGTQGLLKLIG